MNPLASLKKHLTGIQTVMRGKMKPETRQKAAEMIFGVLYVYGQNPVEPAKGVSAEFAEAPPAPPVMYRESWNNAPEAKETAFMDQGEPGPGVVPVIAAEVVLTPVSDHEIEGDNGGSGMFYPSSVTMGGPVEEIGGWPAEAEVEMLGLASNRRSIRGVSGGKAVCVERSLGNVWKAGERVKCRLVRAGGVPLYRMLPKSG